MKQGELVRIIRTHGRHNGKIGILKEKINNGLWTVSLPCKKQRQGYYNVSIVDPDYQLITTNGEQHPTLH